VDKRIQCGLRGIGGLLATLTLLSANALAQNVTITVSGTYSASAATNAFTVPNANWTLSFQVAQVPSVSFSTANQFRIPYTNGVFTLNGVPAPMTGNTVVFYTSANAFDIYLDSAVNTQFEVYGGPVFSGTTANPTILTGTYVLTGVESFTVNPGGGFFDGPSAIFSNAVIAPSTAPGTPAPTSVILVSLGLAGLALLELMRRRRADAV
jgi:MYXO-CTERM domain-containing protein